MPWEGWLTLAIIGLMGFALVRNYARPDTVLLAGLAVLMTAGLFSDGRLPSPAGFVAGFGNEGLISIGVLFVLAEGLTRTGAMSMLTKPILGEPRTVISAQARMMPPVAALSAFMNNTPIVAMFMPVVGDWCKKTGLAPSKLLIPLSYAAVLGGTCTLIGTSTNLVVHGLVLAEQKAAAPGLAIHGVTLNMFTVTIVGLPATLVGLAYILLASRALLPEHRETPIDMANARRFTVEMLVTPGSAIDGMSISRAGLRHLPGVFLAAIERDGERLVAVGPEQILHGNDRLIFFGVVESVVHLQNIRGLAPATDQVFKLNEPRPNRVMVEAVVSDTCPLVGKTIREGRFRTVYDAVVIAVHRAGEHLYQKIGDIRLQPGDTLLIETHPRFVEQQRASRDFYLASALAGAQPVRHEYAIAALGVMLAMILAVTFTPMTLLNGALLASGAMVLIGCCTASEARSAIDWRVLLAVGAAIGIGKAMASSGAAERIATMMLDIFQPAGVVGVVAGIYLLTMIFNMMIGHAGAAVLAFPIALVAAGQQDLAFTPLAVTIMMAASADFANPVSYPTHLMVYGAGGYRFSDYVKFGLPLNFIVMAVTVAICAAWLNVA